MAFLNETTSERVNIEIIATKLDMYHDVIIGIPTIKEYDMLSMFASRFRITKCSLAREFRPLGHQISSSDLLPSTIATLYQTNTKRHTELLTIEPENDEIEKYSHEAPWDIDKQDIIDAKSLMPKIEGSQELKLSLNQLCTEFKEIFSLEVQPEPADVPPFHIRVDETKWKVSANRTPHRPQTMAKQYETAAQIEKMLKLNIIKKSQSAEHSQVLLTPKPNGKWRFCIDFRNLNNCSESMGWPIPNIEQMMRRIGTCKPKVFGVMDLTSGYHQAPLSESSQVFTAFITFMGVFEWLRVPMGPKGAPSYFQQIMATVVLAGLIYHILEIYLDDIIVHGNSEEEFLNRLRLVFERLRKHRITLNPTKCIFGAPRIEYTGHVLDEKGISFSKKKLDMVINFKKPENQKELKSFLGLVTYFHSHIRNHSMIVRPLHEMVRDYKPRNKLQWNSGTTAAFLKIQEAINNCPTLYYIDDFSPIFLHTDASDYGIGAYLFQLKEGIEYPIAFISKAFKKEQLRWGVPDKEAYVIFYAFNKLEYLIRDVHFTLRTDHKNLTYINLENTGKVKRWKLAIQEFDFDIEHIPGHLNVVADAFSRLIPIDEFPASEHLCILDEFKIPKDKYKLIAGVHNSLTGHHGVERTCDKLEKQGHKWIYMKEHVKRFIKKNCPCCQKMSYIKIPIHTHPFTTASYSIMERVNVDTIGPFPEDEYKNKYIIVFICCFSRFIELYAVKDLTAKSAAIALLQWTGRYGCPAQLLSDNGSQYVNELIKEFLHIIGTEHVLTLAYSKEENAIVERANKEVGRHLKAILFHKNVISNWSIFLPLVQRIFNAEVKESLGVSPAQILFGNAITLDRGIFLPHTMTDLQPQMSLSEWTSKMLHSQEELIRIAYETQTNKDRLHMTSVNEENTYFLPNTYVLVKYENRPPSKLHTNWKGPMRVVNSVGSKYTVHNMVTDELENHHVSQLKQFEFDPEMTDPQLVANKDQQLFDVESILEMRGDPNKSKKQLFFLVRWKGLTSVDDSWLPWKELRNNSILHAFLIDNKLKRLVP